MENSERQQRAISLGKALVQELKLEPGVDTLSKWIAHYITEQMATAESATGAEKAEAEKRCFDSIMQLWEHRYALPNERSPFKNFVPIFETLHRLNPENQEPYYLGWENHYQNDADEDSQSDLEKVQSWLRMAFGIDKTARVLLETILQQAALSATNQEVRAWLKRVPESSRHFDVQTIIQLVPDPDLDSDEELNDEESPIAPEMADSESDDQVSVNRSLQAVELRLQYLEEFLSFSTLLHDALQQDLSNAKT